MDVTITSQQDLANRTQGLIELGGQRLWVMMIMTWGGRGGGDSAFELLVAR